MREIPVTNNKKHPIYVGSVMVPAGETRVFPRSQVPPHLLPAVELPKPEPEQDPVLTILDHKIAHIVEMFPSFSNEELAKLKHAEEAGNTRKGLMAAIAEEELRRANEKAGGEVKDPKGDKESGDNPGDNNNPGGDH